MGSGAEEFSAGESKTMYGHKNKAIICFTNGLQWQFQNKNPNEVGAVTVPIKRVCGFSRGHPKRSQAGTEGDVFAKRLGSPQPQK